MRRSWAVLLEPVSCPLSLSSPDSAKKGIPKGIPNFQIRSWASSRSLAVKNLSIVRFPPVLSRSGKEKMPTRCARHFANQSPELSSEADKSIRAARKGPEELKAKPATCVKVRDELSTSVATRSKPFTCSWL